MSRYRVPFPGPGLICPSRDAVTIGEEMLRGSIAMRRDTKSPHPLSVLAGRHIGGARYFSSNNWIRNTMIDERPAHDDSRCARVAYWATRYLY